MFHTELWFAWYPVKVRTRLGYRWTWLETVYRERAASEYGVGSYRHYLY